MHVHETNCPYCGLTLTVVIQKEAIRIKKEAKKRGKEIKELTKGFIKNGHDIRSFR